MKDLKFKLKERKMFILEEYAEAVEKDNFGKAKFLRGKLSIIDEVLGMINDG